MKTLFSVLLFCLLSVVSAFSQEAQKFDEFEDLNCDDYLGRMDNVLVYARDNPTLTVYVLIYEGKVRNAYDKTKTESRLPTFGSAEAKIRSIKKRLPIRKFPVRRFSFVKAGFREYAMIEIWMVPAGAAPPKPAPTLTKMKYRKGRAAGFCIECCGP